MIGFSRVVPTLIALIVAASATAAAPAKASPGGTGPEASACSADAWVDVRCYGATGNGVADDTAAMQRALAAALENDQPLFLSPGTFRITRPLVIDYKTRADTGFRLISMGAVINGKSIATAPVLEIVMLGGQPARAQGLLLFQRTGYAVC
jgi:polygalacturonase